MRDAPNTYTADHIKHEHCVQAGLPDGRWVMARPMGWSGLCLRMRLRAAWLVFTGRADVLMWEGGQ
jgi:hypothetical protein